MIRQNIILGNYTYLIDLYKVNTDIKKVDIRYKSFYFFRKYNLMNDILYDTNIYIIDEDDYSKVKNNEGNIIYPITNKSYVGYSNNIYSFNDDLSIDNLDNNIYNFYSIENNLEIASIPCDVLRIYFPEVHVGLDCILDVENFINSINFHYLIKDISKYKTKLENELKVNNSTYCEYIDIYIPNIESLFSDDILVIDHNGTNLKELYSSADNIYIPFNSLLLPFRIEKPDINGDYSEYSNIKVYEIDKYYSKSSNGFSSKNIKYLYSSFNVILYPYQDIDNTGQYILDKNLDYNSDIFSYDKSFELKVELRFPRPDDFNTFEEFESIEGIPSLIAKFDYPYDDIFDLNTSYLKLNKITFEEYEDITKEEIDDYSEELDLETSIAKTGFYIEFASDKDFKNIIYNFNINIDLESGKVIDDLIFPLNEIFNTWSNYLDLITCRIIYIDKVTNNYIYSNPVILTKEWYKYLINEDEKYRLTYLRKNYDTIDSYIEKLNNEEEGMVFLDNINCSIIVNNESETKNITKKNNPRIIYKPIFYKVGDLQNIRIKEGIKQNIGINLGDILSKVERFKMKINDEEIIESGRNDIYVLFQINSTSFTSSSGKYIIVNQDNEFISDGNWYLY